MYMWVPGAVLGHSRPELLHNWCYKTVMYVGTGFRVYLDEIHCYVCWYWIPDSSRGSKSYPL